MFRYPTYYKIIHGQGFGILFRSVIFSVLSSLLRKKHNKPTSALLRDLQKMAASKSIF